LEINFLLILQLEKKHIITTTTTIENELVILPVEHVAFLMLNDYL